MTDGGAMSRNAAHQPPTAQGPAQGPAQSHTQQPHAQSPSALRRTPQWTSHLRQFSRTSLDKMFTDPSRSPDDASSTSTVRDSSASRPPPPPQPSLSHASAHAHAHAHAHGPAHARPSQHRTCTIAINDSVIGDDVYVNLDLIGRAVRPGMLMSICPVKYDPSDRASSASHGPSSHGHIHGLGLSAPGPSGVAAASAAAGAGSGLSSSYRHSAHHRGSHDSDAPSRAELESERRYIFVAKDMSKEMKARLPNVEIYLAKHIGDAFNMKKGTQVVLAPIDQSAPALEASHVELSFKDMYLSRSDMWQLAAADLVDRTIYKGQIIYYLGTVKATISAVFVDGRRVKSAFFGHNTRPIFRSESARYTLFVQMAREMWDFDSDGSGGIMFSKLVNGFLPGLFKKWAQLQVKHLVSIVLFTRMEYDTGLTTELAASPLQDEYYTGYQTSGQRRPYKDFYRVVVSEMSSGEWTKILHQLKAESNVFRRDINLHHQEAMKTAARAGDPSLAEGDSISSIRAEPALAMYGNVLEAINLASSQYTHDYIDRDLLRTGISIVVITPGSAVFEVDYDALRNSTDALISNGIGVDLVCLPNMPLHSVPLFRYRNPHYLGPNHRRTHAQPLRSHDGTPRQPTTLSSSYNTITGSLSPTKNADGSALVVSEQSRMLTDEWVFAMPQWLHISFWTGKANGSLSFHGASLSVPDQCSENRRQEFITRCRMYNLQMRSVLETNEIQTTPLHADAVYPSTIGLADKWKSRPATRNEASDRLHRRVPDTLFEPVYGFQKFRPDKLAKADADVSVWKRMQMFDDQRARLPATRPTDAGAYKQAREPARRRQDDTGSLGTSLSKKRGQTPPVSLSSSVTSTSHMDLGRFDKSRRDSVASQDQVKRPVKTPKFIRQISLGQRGFGIAAPKAAMAELKTETVNAMYSNTEANPVGSKSLLEKGQFGPSNPKPIEAGAPSDARSHGEASSRTPKASTSRPIYIKSPNLDAAPGATFKPGSILPPAVSKSARHDDRDLKTSNAVRAEDEQKMYTSKLLAGALPELPATMSPVMAQAPWLVVFNPSNPNLGKVDDTLLFSRWQHVFPRSSNMKIMKWKSLSCPAAVPLTTEHFPTRTQLENEFQRQPYNVSQDFDDEDSSAEPRSREDLLRELIYARFAYGFQVVIGSAVTKALGQKSLKVADIFGKDRIVEDGTSIFMSVGNTVHQLSCVNATEVEVNIFTRKPNEPSHQASQALRLYKPAIRTLVEEKYHTFNFDLFKPTPDKNWNYIDSYLAGHRDEMTDSLRFWRARFVLIPMHPRVASSTSKSQTGDNDEEIRLEGIKRLAQMWQKHRVVSPSERQFQGTSGAGERDFTPLDILYKTDDPSVAVNLETESLPAYESLETTHRKNQLVSNKERFTKKNFNVAALAEAIQQPPDQGGIKMQPRRWHIRVHQSCFIGSEMTTWLLEHFEDLSSREEAVELGNSLMIPVDKHKDKEASKEAKKERDRGIFVHVDKRHNFRDGQFFYHVSGEHAKPNQTGWFTSRKKDSTTPVTPLTENLPKDSPRLGLTSFNRPTSISEGSPISGATTPTISTAMGKRPKVDLSKMMRYDVDHRKKSFRPEIVTLHYDRLHNPDNCFHIRLDWVNVTAKLIEDAIKQWAAIATQHGLRLVEVPIAEAHRINDVNPFREPKRVRLCVPPPALRPLNYFDPNTMGQQAHADRHFYQVAILKKLDYVLDIEAAANFSPSVDVTYSWGRPDFKYSQYIHRTGMALVQIADDGSFLMLANRLYSNRAFSNPSAAAAAMAARGSGSGSGSEAPQKNDRVTRLMSGSAAHGLPEPTPISSPMFRPVLFAAPTATGSRHPAAVNEVSATAGGAGGGGSGSGSGSKPGGNLGLDGLVLEEQLRGFCSDAGALEAFYREVLERRPAAGQAGPGTPATTASAQSSLSGAEEGGGGGGSLVGPESSIPALGLPPSLLTVETPASSSSISGGGNARPPPPPATGSAFLRRGSVQY